MWVQLRLTSCNLSACLCQAVHLANMAATCPAHAACISLQAGRQQQSLQQELILGYLLVALQAGPLPLQASAGHALHVSLLPSCSCAGLLPLQACLLWVPVGLWCQANWMCTRLSCNPSPCRHELFGVFMRNWDESEELGNQNCSVEQDRRDAQQVCRWGSWCGVQHHPCCSVAAQLCMAAPSEGVHTTLQSARQLLPGRQASRP